MNTLLAKIKAALEADATLAAYNEIVSIEKWRPDSLPDFETYGIVISPEGMTPVNLAVGQKQNVIRVHVVCLVANFDPVKSLSGENAGEVGINKMVNDVYNALLDNDFDEHVELLGDELDAPTPLNQVYSAARDRFYHEVKLEGAWRLQPYLV